MKTRRAIVWTFVGQACLFTVQFACQIILARLLTPYEVGVYAAGLATMGAFAAIQALGLVSFIVRERNIDTEIVDTAFTINGLLNAGLCVLTFGASFLLGELLNDASVPKVLRTLSIIPLLGIFDFRPTALLQRELDFRSIAVATVGRSLVTATATLTLAFVGFSYMSMAIGVLVGSVCGTCLLNCLGWNHVAFRLSFRRWREVTTFGLHMLTISGANQISTRLSDVILGRIMGISALGYFSRAASVVALMWESIYLVLARVLLAQLAEQRRQEGGAFKTAYLKIVANMTAFLWPLFGGLAVLARPLVHVVYGSRWEAAAVPLSLLSGATMVLVTITMAWEVFVINEETARQARLEGVRSLASVVIFAIGCLFGLAGAGIARVAAAIFSQVLYAPHLARMTETSARDFVPVYSASLLVTAVTLAPATALMMLEHWSYQVDPLMVGAAVLCGLVLWVAMIFWIKHPLNGEIRTIWQLVARGLGGPAPSGETAGR